MMNSSKVYCILLFYIALLMPVAGFSGEQEERAAITDTVIELAEKQDFAKLETLANKYLKNKEKTGSGNWKLAFFGGGIERGFDMNVKDEAYWSRAEQFA